MHRFAVVAATSAIVVNVLTCSSSFQTEKKGWGLFADQDLEEDDLIVNYVGEVIPTGMWKARLAEYDGERHWCDPSPLTFTCHGMCLLLLCDDQFARPFSVFSSCMSCCSYFLNLDSQYVIDASRRGNVGRFINHSCDPNTRTEKW